MNTQSRLDEIQRIETIASDSWYARGANAVMIRYSFRIFQRWMLGGSKVLELGPAEGLMTELLAAAGYDVTAIEGSEWFATSLKTRFPQIRVHHSLFETFDANGELFNYIILGHVLEHVQDPVKLLRQARIWLEPNGFLLAAVPNARSLHRQAGVLMGLLSREDDLNDADRHHGHRRVFNPESFRAIFYQAGWHIEYQGGYWLKPLSDAQIEKNWSSEMLEAFMQLGERYPDIAGELYVVARLSEALPHPNQQTGR